MTVKTRPQSCPSGYDPHFWHYYPERIETGVDLFRGDAEPKGKKEWEEIFPSVGDVWWWTFGNSDDRNGWSYHELAESLVANKNFADMGRSLIPHEAQLTNGIMGNVATGHLVGPAVVICNPGPNATIARHFTLHVFAHSEGVMQKAIDESVGWMIKRGYVLPHQIEKRNNRIPITHDLRADVWDKTRGKCWYCGVEMHPFRNYHVDHFIPVIDGGTNDISNLVPSCQSCNSRKHARPAEYLRRFIASGKFYGEGME